MKPPGAARRFLAFSLPLEDRTDVIANLDDLYAARARRVGRVRADAWYWRQAFTFAVRMKFAGVRHGGATSAGTGWSGDENLRSGWWLDVRYAVRGFVRTPRVAIAGLVTLVLGLGGATLMWAIVYGTLIRPSGYPDASRLVWVWPSGEQPLSLARFTRLQPQAGETIELSAFAGRQFALTGGAEAQEVQGIAVSANHFDVFGATPVVGRGFTESDALADAEPVAVISHELWRRQFGSDPGVFGRLVDVYASAAIPMVPGAFTGMRHRIVGVAPAGYRPFGFVADVITPLRLDASAASYTNMSELLMVGRLAEGASAVAARRRIAGAAASLDFPEEMRTAIAGEAVVPLRSALDAGVRPAMMLSLAGVGLVLLLACVNVANLLLVRTHERYREFAVKQALGAGTRRLARQQFTEVGVLVLAASVVAIVLARAVLPAVLAVLPAGIAIDRIALDAIPLAVAFGLIVPTALLCGALPVIARRSDTRTAAALRRDGSRRGTLLNDAFVILQITLALALGHAAGQLITGFLALARTPTGFTSTDVMTVRIAPSSTRYRDAAVRVGLYDRILAAARQVPGVEAAGAIHFLPIADGGPSVYFRTDPADAQTVRPAAYRVITPGYMETLRIPLRRGRGLQETDRAGAAAAGLINESMAEALWPGEDAVGRPLYRSDGRTWFTVVGVVGDIRQASLAAAPEAEIYLPLAQSEWASAMTIVMRTTSPQPAAEALRTIVHAEDPGLPITRAATMEAILSRSVAEPRFYSIVFIVFAAIAVLLGGVGVYGVTSFVVTRRTDEIGLRLALGETTRGVLRREMGRGVRLVMTGVTAGLLVSIFSTKLLGSVLADASAFDPAAFAIAALVIAGIALGAVAIPARKAARTDPMLAMRAG